MATEKQIEWLSKLAKWKGVKLDLDVARKLDNGQLDEIFESLKSLKVTNGKKEQKTELIKPSEYNGARFGLACKLVLNNLDWEFVIHNPDTYKKRIAQVYFFMTAAEELFKETVAVGDVDADQLLDEQRDKELIAAKVM